MTSSSVFGQASPGALSSAVPPPDQTYGLLVTMASAQPLLGIWYYSGPGEAALPDKCGVWDVASQALVAGTVNTSPSWSGAAGSGWVKCTYDGSVTLSLTAVAAYAPAVHWPSGTKGFLSGYSYPVAGAGGGQVSAPVDRAGVVNNAPFAGAGGWAFPNSDGSNGKFWWGVDIEVGSAPVPDFSAAFVSTDGNGIQTWNVTSRLNGGATPVATRVLPPSSPAPGHPHAFLWCLTVEPGQGSTFGDPLAVILALGAHNAYNVTCVELGYAISPWYADNPGDSTISQETFILDAVTWAQGQFGSGGEAHNLIGFSKSGLGGQGLIFRHPAVFAKAASWDAPFGMTDYDGTDPDFPGSPVGGGSAAVYGTSANFTANYELDTANLTAWRNASNFASSQRLWAGGFSTFQGDVEAYHPLLASLGILHAYAEVSASAHAWAPSPGWVGPALAWMFPSGSGLLMASGII